MYFSSNIISVIRPGMKRRAGYVAHGRIKEMHDGVWWGNLKERDHFQDLDVHGTIILKLI